ncbi:hypothetical protein GGI20_005103 [Coemansia sp. BCRC 34301]|nr:hypothetical protein GGI20_005103 [Coemansia sp. BCRC 34301]
MQHMAVTYEDISLELLRGILPMNRHQGNSQRPPAAASTCTEDDDDEYKDVEGGSVRRSARRRTQRVLLNVPAHESTGATAPAAHRRFSLRSVASSSRRLSGISQNSHAHHPRKRHNPGRADSPSSSSLEDSVDSDLSCEVSIDTRGTAIPHNYDSPAESTTQTCFICNNVLDGDMDSVNAHIDGCLAKSAGSLAAQGPMVEYEWGGQRRVRATAMLEGGLVAAGIGHGSSSTSLHNDNDDVDVDADDETNYGAAQYSDKHLLFASSSTNRKGSRRNATSQSHARRPSNPRFEEFAPPLDDTPDEPPLSQPESSLSAAASWQQASTGGGGSQLIIDALKERIREQDRLLRSVQKCLICLEHYEKPCTSINCWHVYCEKCWLQTLGTKKLCPQCQQITQPTDLRRVYL